MLTIGKCYIAPWAHSTKQGLLLEGSMIFVLELIGRMPKHDSYYYKALKSDGTIIVLVVSGTACRNYWKILKC